MVTNVAQRLRHFMDYDRLFYMNITYECNNHCVYCISHNTKNKTKKVKKPLNILQLVNTEYNFSSKDLFIVNGGEPSLSPYFSKILDFLLQTKINIIVYTNGRTLSNYLHYTESNRIRWIVPFYGLQNHHAEYTGEERSFSETFEAIKCIAPKSRKNISIKFLLEDENQLSDFIELSKQLSDYKEIHVSFVLNANLEKRVKLGKIVSPLFSDLLKNHNVKLSNVPLCSLQSELQIIIKRNIEELIESKIGVYYFIDEYGVVKTIDYDINHNWFEKCKDCQMLPICCDNYKKYRVLKIYKNNLSLEEE